MGYMQSANVKNIVPKLNNLFHEKNYFSVASYGREIEEGSSEGKDPYGIMLPFLWTLAVFGYLSPVKLEQVPKLKGKSFWRKISGNDDDDIQKIIVDADRTELFL